PGSPLCIEGKLNELQATAESRRLIINSPDHRPRARLRRGAVRIEHGNEPRTEVARYSRRTLYVSCSGDRSDRGEGAVQAIGEQMLADAHGCDDQNAVPTFFGYNGPIKQAHD